MAVLFQLVIAYLGLCFVAGMTCLAIGIFVIALTLTKDVRNDLNLINESVKSEQPLSQVRKQLVEFVRAHSHGKQLREYDSKLHTVLISLKTILRVKLIDDMIILICPFSEWFSSIRMSMRTH